MTGEKFLNFYNSKSFVFFFWVGGGGGMDPSSLLLRPLWYQPQMTMSFEQLVVETKVLGENLPQCHFVNHKSHMT
jgi:hypothetical protein